MILRFKLKALCKASLSYTSNPFCSGYFENMVLLFAQVGLDCDPPIFGFLPHLEWQALTTMPSFFLLRWGLENFFFFA
jgi:hypothetical protein